MPSIDNVKVYGLEQAIKSAKYAKAVDVDSLNCELTKGIKVCANCNTGEGHDTFLKGIIVNFDLTFSLKAWCEWQRYHFSDIVTSQSTMHKITKFDLKKQCNKYVDPRIIDILQAKVDEYNRLLAYDMSHGKSVERKNQLEEMFLDIVYNIPSGFELRANVVTNYLQLKTMYQQRRHHRLKDWEVYCDWCETLPLFKELCIDRNKTTKKE